MSIATHRTRAAPRRSYRLGKRANKQQETRQRIVEAAVELHGTIGPSRTTVAQIADRAGVQRHTYYAHFPDERGLFIACSALAMERDPMPDAEQWRQLAAGADRVRSGLEALYSWYDRNAQLMENVLRDAAFHPLTGEMVDLRIRPPMELLAEILGDGLDDRRRILLDLALDFACWRRLGKSMSPASAAGLMTGALLGLGAS